MLFYAAAQLASGTWEVIFVTLSSRQFFLPVIWIAHLPVGRPIGKHVTPQGDTI